MWQRYSIWQIIFHAGKSSFLILLKNREKEKKNHNFVKLAEQIPRRKRILKNIQLKTILTNIH